MAATVASRTMPTASTTVRGRSLRGRRIPIPPRIVDPSLPGRQRLRVVVEGDLVGDRVRLAGQDDAGLDLVGLEGVVAVHPHLTGHETGAAGTAYPVRARERRVGTDPQRRVEDRLVERRHRDLGGP